MSAIFFYFSSLALKVLTIPPKPSSAESEFVRADLFIKYKVLLF